MMSRTFISIFTVLLFVSSVSFAKDAPSVGDMAPDFELLNEAGQSVKLSDFSGKTVVLEWTNPDCPFVKRHYNEKTMETLAGKYSKQNVVWLAVNSTHYMDGSKNKQWRESQNLSFPVLNDQDGKIGKLYGAKTTPHMFVIGSDGKIAYQGAIDDDKFGDKKVGERLNYVDSNLPLIKNGEKPKYASTTPYGCSVKYKK